jgi:hypothetical protein
MVTERGMAHLREDFEGEETQLAAAVAWVVGAVASIIVILRQILLNGLSLQRRETLIHHER